MEVKVVLCQMNEILLVHITKVLNNGILKSYIKPKLDELQRGEGGMLLDV